MKKKDIETDNDHPVLKPTPAALKETKRVTSSWKSFVIFGVGAADSERRWSHKNFVELAKKISDAGMQLDIVLCGSARSRLDFHAVKSALEIVTGRQNQIT